MLLLVVIFRSLRSRCAHVLRSMQILFFSFPSSKSSQCHGFCNCFRLLVQYFAPLLFASLYPERGTRCCLQCCTFQTNKYAANGWQKRKMTRKFRIQILHARKYLFFAVHCLHRKRGRRIMDIFDLFGFWFSFDCSFHHLYSFCMLSIDSDCSRLLSTQMWLCISWISGDDANYILVFLLFLGVSASLSPPHSSAIRSVVVAVDCYRRHSRSCFFSIPFFHSPTKCV